jgi:hypothetical protein
MRRRFPSFWSLVLLGLLVSPCAAQERLSARDQVLRLVPADTGVCLIVSDLREQAGKLRSSVWLSALLTSPLGRALAASPEAARLDRFKADLKKHLHVDWPQLRDDILGDLVVFAYRPPPPGRPNDEQGLVLLQARDPALLAQVIERLNQAQTQANELKELTEIEYQGTKFFRRVEAAKTSYYLLQGPLLAFSSQEDLIRKVIDLKRDKTAANPSLIRQLEYARAAQALAVLWLNPRAFDADLEQKASHGPAPHIQVLQTFLTYWKALDAVVVSVQVHPQPELSLSLQARSPGLPEPLRRLFAERGSPSELWARFPQRAILRLAGRVDAVALARGLSDFAPPSSRQLLADSVQRTIGAALGLDLAKDVLPNLGPNWGLCIAPAPVDHDFPLVVAALAIQPGTKEPAVDQTLAKAVHLLAGLAVFDYNRTHADVTQLKTSMQDKVEVKYLVNDKRFPSGLQPAFALKDGYFLLASSPEAIRRFHKVEAPTFPADEVPLLHLSFSELATFLKNRRAKVVTFLAASSRISETTAGERLDDLLAGLALFDHILLSEVRETGQVRFVVRLGVNKQ